MKKGKYFVTLKDCKREVEGFIIIKDEQEFGIDKRDYGWVVTHLTTGFKAHETGVDYYNTKKEAIEALNEFYIKYIEKFKTIDVEKLLKKIGGLPINQYAKI